MKLTFFHDDLSQIIIEAVVLLLADGLRVTQHNQLMIFHSLMITRVGVLERILMEAKAW